MVTYWRTLSRVILSITCLFCLIIIAKGQDNPFVNVLRGDSGKLVKNAVLTTADLTYYIDPENPRYDTVKVKYGNVISLAINQQSGFYITSNFTVSVPLHITMVSATDKDADGNFRSIEVDTSLVLNYRKDSGTYVSRSFLVDSGFRYVTVKIRNDITSSVSWDVTKVLMLENEMRITRDYFFELPNQTASINSFSTQAATSLACGVFIDSIRHYYIITGTDTAKDEILLRWNDPKANQTGYDLEWAWIDQSALPEFRQGGRYSDDLVFKNNATRVTLEASKLSYAIPTLYDDAGKLFYRVRPVQDRSDGSRQEGAWTIAEETNRINAFDFNGHQNNLNWQVTTSYAEEGKRKTVIQYFDGTLRSRQTVTKDNTLGTTVVAETMYDYQGRPAIQVLPAPTLSTMIGFTKNFNRGLNAGGGGVDYTKDLYDGLNAGDIICLKPAEKMVTDTGASRYYSSANPEKNDGINRYIPDAQGYPFTETRYTPDATGRIAAQSGVGIAHTLGSGHETRYYYGQADQEDLDPLFGTDVGYASHYFKNMVRDANGQYSVSYVDMHGRTVATALAGKNPDSLQPLPSLIPRNSVTKKLLDKETNIVKDRSIESQKELLVPVRGSYIFNYEINPQSLSLLDKNGNSICYSCMYDLEIEISNDCGNCNLPNNQPVYIRKNNFRVARLDTSTCQYAVDTIALKDTITLAEGSYTVRKTLTLSRQAQDAYRDGLYTRRNTVRTFESAYQEILTAMQLAGTNCADTSCGVCKDRLGDSASFTNRYLAEAQITDPTAQQKQEITAAYKAALAQCDAICTKGTSPLDGIRGAMLQDMMPDSGQYAIISTPARPYNIFNASINGWKRPYNEATDQPACYQDGYGNCVVVAEAAATALSPIPFINVFQASWANNLLHYHPEYYRLRLAEDPAYLKPSYDFDRQIQDSTTWAGALRIIVGRGNTNINIEAVDPFFGLTGNGSLKTTMHGYASSNYKTVNNINCSMWRLACAAVVCTDPNAALSCVTGNTLSNQFGTFPPGTCTQDQDMIWNAFRQMYLFEKQKMVYSWTTAKIQTLYQVTAPTTAQLAAQNYTPRFVDPATLSSYPGGLVGITPVSQNNINPTIYTGPATTTLNSYYNDNCTALATNWRNRLEILKNCKPSITNADLDGLTTTLIEICKKGSDLDHPLGSASVPPGSTHTPPSFELAIRDFLIYHQMAYSGSCNPYMLSDIDPGLYTASQVYYNPQIVSKPSDCQCTRISTLFSEYKALQYAGTFSVYMQNYYGTTISQGALDTLINLCDSSYSCNLLPSPISLPPVLQCGVPTQQVCIDCQTFLGYKNNFRDTFGTVWPQANHPGDVIQPLDSAFTAFVNYKTGFTKTAFDYLRFNASCPFAQDYIPICTHLDSVVNGYIAQREARSVRIYGADSCDNSHWYSTYGGHYTDNSNVSLSSILVGGEFKPYFDGTPNVAPSQIEFVDNICFDSLIIETRLKMPRSGVGFNPWGSPIYSFEQPMYFTGARGNFAFDVDQQGNWYMYYQRDINSPSYSRIPLSIDFDQYRIFRIVVGRQQYHVYIDNQLIGDFMHVDYAGRKFERIFTQGYGADFRIDYLKLINYDGTVLMNEDFNHTCSQMARVVTEPCDLTDCPQAFARYYNSVSGTSYTFDQLDNISLQNCGKRLQVCNTNPRQNLDSIVAAFTTRRNYRLDRHIDAATGCDTTHWVSNYGEGNLQVEPLSRVIKNGTFVPARRGATESPSSLDYVDTICFQDSMTIKTRLKLPQVGPGYNPFNSNYYSFEQPLYFTGNATDPNRARSNFAFDLHGTNATMYYQRDPVYSAPPQLVTFNFNSYSVLEVRIGNDMFHVYIDGKFIGDYPHVDYRGRRFAGMYDQGYADTFRIDWLRIYDKSGNMLLNEDFDEECGNLARITKDPCEPEDCSDAFTQFYNNSTGASLTYSQIDSISRQVYGKPLSVCGNSNEPHLLCGLNQPRFPAITVAPDTCGAELKDLAFNKATEYYQYYKDSLRNVFDTAYYNKCLRAAPPENLTVTYDAYEYHYTLYYYDQAGNLVQTVPPQGVHAVYDTIWMDSVALARQSGAGPVRPAHTLKTQYRYNTLNQVVEQLTPDAGKSNFWYDRLGRLVVSQNARQVTTNRYSYTLYDGIGRITEVGQKPKATPNTLSQAVTLDTTALKNWLTVNGNKEEITRTVYDVAYLPLVATPDLIVQQNLRNRVSYTLLYDKETDQNNASVIHKAATFYTYDIHGNVSTLLQDINQGVMRTDSSSGNRFKRIDYTYDLISGKVNAVAYQRGWQDQFFHRYSYDAENRITEAWTSPDSIYWERDAQYKYYKHGPLARTVLGQLQVQGIDYAYTLQGWMKGINSTSLQTTDDMGHDGVSSTTPAKDVLGFSLNYYNNYAATQGGAPLAVGDYQPIGAGVLPFAAVPGLPAPAGQTKPTGGPLYNGNISRMMLNLPRVGEPILYNYTYDQLNRIVAMDAYYGLNSSTNSWTPVSTQNYKERIAYDANGNILTYLRNGYTAGGRQPEMDNLTYQYERDAITGALRSNRLRYVHDQVNAANYTVDIDDETGGASLAAVQADLNPSQPGDNYQYDPIGNLVKDAAGKLDAVTWTVYGKIKDIAKTDGTIIRYTYDAAGNRITKTVTLGTTVKRTVYVRDAQGNVLSVYTRQNNNNLKQAEVDLYGSSRLGIWKPNRDVQQLEKARITLSSFVQGAKEYELSNHLGNVMATVADTRTAVPAAGGTTTDHYEAVVLSAHDYYPFGMQLPGRNRTDGTAGTADNPTGRLHIEAEAFTAQNNVGIREYYLFSGGKDIGPLTTGAWADYTITAPVAGLYTIRFRLSNLYTAGQLQLRNAQDGVLATINVYNTGGYEQYYTHTIQVALPAGTQTLRLYCAQNAFGVDWWELLPPGTLSGTYTSATTQRIEAEDYIDRQGMAEETCYDAGGTLSLAAGGGGQSADYRISVPLATNYTVRLRVATGAGYGVTLSLRNAANNELAVLNVPFTGGYQTYTTLTASVPLVAGEQVLRVYTNGGSYSLNWLEIERPATADNGALVVSNNTDAYNSLIYDSENNFTIEFWVKPKYPHEIDEESNWGTAGLSGQKYVIFPGSGGDGYGSRAGAGISVGTNGVSVYEHADSYLPAVLVWQSDTTITSWMHVAVVYTNGRPSLYINGQFRRQGVQSGRGHVFASTQFPGGYTSAEGGQLDELRIWKVSRTEQQIRDNMNGEIPGNTPNLAGYWPMNEGSGNVLHDVSGNGRDVGLNGSYGAGNWTAGRYSVELSSNYRYGFNGQEHSTEIGDDSYTAEYWEYDSRIGRRWNVDPKIVIGVSDYACLGNNPIYYCDIKGDFKTRFGAWLYNKTHGGTGTIGRDTKTKQYFISSVVGNANGEGISVQRKFDWGIESAINNFLMSRIPERTNSSAKWLDVNDKNYQIQRESAIRQTKANWQAEEQYDKPFINVSLALTHGHYGIGGDFLGGELGVRVDHNSMDLLGIRDNQVMALGKPRTGTDKGKIVRTTGAEVELVEGGYGGSFSTVNGQNSPISLKRKYGPVGFTTVGETVGNYKAASATYSLAGFQAGIGLIGVDFGVDVNLNSRSNPIVISPPRTGKEVAESTRPPDIFIRR